MEFNFRRCDNLWPYRNGIIALTEILISELDGIVDEDALKNLEIINVSGNRLNNMVTNLLDASLINEKKLNIRSEPVGLQIVAPAPLLNTTTMKNVDVLSKLFM